MCEEYQGWENYPTWAVHLWLTNDQGTESYWREVASHSVRLARHVSRKGWTLEETARMLLADRLKESLDGGEITAEASLWSDLLSWSLERVNWQHVARALLEDLPELEKEENS